MSFKNWTHNKALKSSRLSLSLFNYSEKKKSTGVVTKATLDSPSRARKSSSSSSSFKEEKYIIECAFSLEGVGAFSKRGSKSGCKINSFFSLSVCRV